MQWCSILEVKEAWKGVFLLASFMPLPNMICELIASWCFQALNLHSKHHDAFKGKTLNTIVKMCARCKTAYSSAVSTIRACSAVTWNLDCHHLTTAASQLFPGFQTGNISPCTRCYFYDSVICTFSLGVFLTQWNFVIRPVFMVIQLLCFLMCQTRQY